MPAAARSFTATPPTTRSLAAVLVAGTLLAAMLGVVRPTPVAAVVTPAPAMVQAQGLTDSTAQVLWSSVTGASSYDVYRDATHVGVAVTSTLFNDTGLTANTTYTYSVTATISGVASSATAAPPATTQATPDTTAPTWTGATPALTASSVTSNSLTLTWSRATDNVEVLGYRILRGQDPTPPTVIATQDVGLTYKVTNLKANTAYTFRVEALDASFNVSSALSTSITTATATDTPPAPPASGTIFATAFSDTRIDLSWGMSAGAVGYQIRRGTTSGGPYTLVGEVDEPASPWFSDTGLTASTPYYYVIDALSSAGNLSVDSAQKTATTLAGGAVKIVRGPYVQWVTSTSARVAWWTNIASPAVVTYGTTGPTGNTESDATSVQEHVILLAPLTANTAYQYAVGDGSVSATGAFNTTAPAGTSFSFDAIGDYGSGSAGEKQNATGIAADTADFLQTLGDNIYSQSADPDFTHIYSETDGHFFKPMQPALSAKALWTANGNKEYYGNGTWFNVIWAPNNERWYSYDWGDAHILVIDSDQPLGPGTPQYAFAQADLAAHQSSVFRIVAIQSPAYSSTTNNSSSSNVLTNLVPLFEAQNVQLVLSGNSHNYERSYPLLGGAPAAGGVTYLVSGNGGNSFNPFTIPEPAWSAYRDATHFGHLHIGVSPTTLTIQEINASDSSVLDSAVIHAQAATYHPLAGPARIVDSRIALGLPTRLSTGVPQSFQVTGAGGVGAGATAITGNLTVTGQTAAGYVALTTSSQVNPPTSTLNFPVGDNRANGVTTPLGAGGKLWAVYKGATAGSTTHLVFDVTGYFTADATGSTYHPLAGPARIVDSRIALGLPTRLSTGVPQSFQVTGAGGVGAGATAITGNLTVTGQTAAGYVALTTSSQVNPPTSTLNFPVGDNRANGVTTPLGAGGKLWAVYKGATAGSTTHLVFDVTGYFTADATGSTYHPLAGPARIVDSRIALGLPTRLSTGVPQSFQVTGAGGVGAGATAITGNLTVTGQTAAGYVALTTSSQVNPPTSTLNFPVGDNRANGVTTPLGAGGKLWAVYKGATAGSTTHLVFDVTGYFGN